MKRRRTISYGTVNPSYPETHSIRYVSRRVCDGIWGKSWTRRYISIELPLDEKGLTALRLKVAKAICRGDGFDWEAQADPMTSGSGGEDTAYYLRVAEDALRAIGVS